MKDVPKIVLQSLSQRQPGPHPDLNLLTAFSEHNLFGSERRRVLEHLAFCSLCRRLVAPIPDVQPTEQPVKNESSWFGLSFHAWRWAIAAVAVPVAVAAIFFVVDRTPVQTGSGNDTVAAVKPANPSSSINEATVPSRVVRPTDSKNDNLRVPTSTSTPAGLSAPFPVSESDPNGKVRVSGEGRILLSPDNGNTWIEAKLPRDVHFRAAAGAGTSLWAGGDNGVVFHSSDGGLKWQSVEVRTADTVLLEAVTRIALIDENRIVIETATGISWTSYDGGASWTVR